MSNPPSPRRRGAQPGNLNRLKHGLYSRRLAPTSASPDPGLQLVLARKRLAKLFQMQESASSPREYLSYERGILHYITLILALTRGTLRPLPFPRIYASGRTPSIGGDGHPSGAMMEAARIIEAEITPDGLAGLNPIRTSAQEVQKRP